MTDKHKAIDLGFTKAAIYKIVVQGELDAAWCEQLWGLQANVKRGKGEKPITTIIGQINDQSALSGILTQINDMHMLVISVNMLSEIEYE